MKKQLLLSVIVSGIATTMAAQANTFPASGNVGIGTDSPTNLLHVFNVNSPANTIGSTSEIANLSGTIGNILQFKFLLKRHTLSGGWENIGCRLQFITDVTHQGYMEFNPKDEPEGIAFGTNTGEIMRLNRNGNVGIGTTNPGSYKLAVEGTIGARKVKVTTASWADYVFEKNYHLPTLAEVEKYIQHHKHLPDVPSVAEIEKDGLDLGDNQAVLLKKIEELTLYAIDQHKKQADQDKKIEQQNKKLSDQQAELNFLKKQLKQLLNK